MKYTSQITPITINTITTKQPKENTATHQRHTLTPEQSQFVEQTFRLLKKLMALKYAKHNLLGLHFEDFVQMGMEKLLNNLDPYMRRYKTPQHCANAIGSTIGLDAFRRNSAQRGEGARRTRRVLGDKPINSDDPNGDTVLTTMEGSLGDPEGWILRDDFAELLRKVSDLVGEFAVECFELVESQGLTQAEAARYLGCSREQVNREINKAKKAVLSLRPEWEGK